MLIIIKHHLHNNHMVSLPRIKSRKPHSTLLDWENKRRSTKQYLTDLVCRRRMEVNLVDFLQKKKRVINRITTTREWE